MRNRNLRIDRGDRKRCGSKFLMRQEQVQGAGHFRKVRGDCSLKHKLLCDINKSSEQILPGEFLWKLGML